MTGQLERVAISSETMARLRSTAVQSHRDESELMEEAVIAYLDRQDMELSAVESGMLSAGAEGLISHDAMTTWLLSWGTQEELQAPKPDLQR
jgi:predicted transcriptional regulator